MSSVAAAVPTVTINDGKGNKDEYTGAAYEAVQAVLQALGFIKNPTAPADIKLSTGEAARIMGTSAKTIGRLIDSGKLQGARAASGHRSVMLSDLMAYDRKTREVAHAHIERARELADKAGLYSTEYASELTAYLDSFA